jgi:hypothetical protein
MRLLNRITNKVLTLFFNLFEPKPKPSESATPNLVAKRFRQLFVDHGIEETQIPRVFSKITLDDLKSDESLLKKLTPDLINEVAELFKVRVEWIEGVDDTIYSLWTCYKQPEKFFKYLKKIKYEEHSFPFRLITTTEKFDYKDGSYQPFSILFVEKIAELGDEDIHRYQLDTDWNWQHSYCRIQIKAMAMLYWQQERQPITIHKVSKEIYEQIEDLSLIPYHYLRGSLVSEPSLEDYVIEPTESRVSKEAEELPIVLKYIEDNNLSEMKVFRSTINSTCNSNDESPKQAKASKGGSAKHQMLSKIKNEFLQQYADQIAANKISARQAAFDFYDSLDEEQEKMLSRSEKDYEKSSPDERRMNAMRTLTSHYSENKKH